MLQALESHATAQSMDEREGSRTADGGARDEGAAEQRVMLSEQHPAASLGPSRPPKRIARNDVESTRSSLPGEGFAGARNG